MDVLLLSIIKMSPLGAEVKQVCLQSIIEDWYLPFYGTICYVAQSPSYKHLVGTGAWGTGKRR